MTVPLAVPDAQDSGSVELWVPMYRDHEHEVSSLGRVRSLPRTVTTKAGVRRRLRGSLITPQLNKDGRLYLRVRGRMYRVHHLVLEAFVGPRPDSLEGCHGNGNPVDNRPENLRWDTHQENLLDAVRHGTLWQTKVINCPFGHTLTEPNLVASALRVGRRHCKACHRGRGSATYLERKTGVKANFQAIADEKYTAIMMRAAA